MTAPWNAFQWVNCNGSVMMQTLFPQTDETDSQREGKAVHWVAENILRAWKSTDTPIPTSATVVGMEAPNGVIIDDDMAQAAIDYVTDIMVYCNETGSLRHLNIEDVLDLSHLGPHMEDGRPDVYIWNPDKYEIFVSELKYGHCVVDVFENHQLTCYVSGIMEKYGITGIHDEVVTVRMRIYQPRAPHIDGPSREWSCKASDLRGHINQIKWASDKAYRDDATCKSGDWCATCTARHGCETFTRDVYAAMSYIGEPTPFNLSGAGLVAEHLLLERAKKLIDMRKSAIDEQCIGAIRNGQNLPGLALEQGFGRETWKKDAPVGEIIFMASMLGVDINKPQEIDTPAQCRKKGIDPEVVKQYTYTPKTKLKIVKDDGRKARQVFRK